MFMQHFENTQGVKVQLLQNQNIFSPPREWEQSKCVSQQSCSH